METSLEPVQDVCEREEQEIGAGTEREGLLEFIILEFGSGVRTIKLWGFDPLT